MIFEYDSRLPVLLTQIEEFVVGQLPKMVREKRLGSSASVLFLWYHDSSSAGDFTPYVGVATDGLKAACEEQGEDKESVVDCYWRPQQYLDDPSNVLSYVDFQDEAFTGRCNDAYAMMLAANTSMLPLPDESEILLPFRTAMHSAAKRLNAMEWSSVLPVIDDFAVVSTDWTGIWCDEDLAESIPAPRYNLLLQRGLLCE